MKVIALVAACITVSGCGDAVVQTWPGPALAHSRGSEPERHLAGQEFFTKYILSEKNTKNGAEALGKIHAYGLPKSADNVNKLRTQLASKISKEERVWMIRLLSRQYTREKTTTNETIEIDLRMLANSEELDTARAAVLAYSRLDYKADKRAVLIAARNRGVIDEDGYYGELAHSIPLSPPSEQVQYLKEIRGAKNLYASEIMAMTVNNPDISAKLQPEAREEIASLLQDTEPTFSQAVGQFDMVEGIRYAAWLRATTSVRESDFNKRSAELMMATLSSERVDPRKILAVLTSDYASQLVSEIGPRSRFELLLQRVSHYARQHPQNRDLKDAVEQVGALFNTIQ